MDRFLGITPLCKTNPRLSLTTIVKFVDWLKALNKVERLKCLWSFVSLSGNVLIEPSVELLLCKIDFSCGHTNKWKLNPVQEVVLHLIIVVEYYLRYTHHNMMQLMLVTLNQ